MRYLGLDRHDAVDRWWIGAAHRLGFYRASDRNL